MISALYRYPKSQRREVARVWGKRSQAVQAQRRIERGLDADTLRRRALHDARGEVIRHGVTYTATREIAWCVRRAVFGRVNQVEIVADGRVWRVASLRRAIHLLRR